MDIQHFGKRINSVRKIEHFGQLKRENLLQARFALKNNEMSFQEVNKSNFFQINDKRYYFEDGVVFLPFLLKIVKYKAEKKQSAENYIFLNKKNLLKMEKKALLKNHRLSTLQSIYLQ